MSPVRFFPSLIAILILCVAASIQVATAEIGRYHALVIGNNDYEHLPKLKTAVADATATAALLRTKYGFKVTLLLNAKRRQEGINNRLFQYPKSARLSITYDNGSENVEHELVNKTLGTKSYFCNPYHSWEKGTVENTCGLIRRYIPKKTDISLIADSEIIRIENDLNNRPRKCLNFLTPAEFFGILCGALPD